MSSGVASRQSAGGSFPWKRMYWSRVNRSNWVPGTPASLAKSRKTPASTSMPPRHSQCASTLPTRGRERLKPLAPPPRPQQKWKWKRVRLSMPPPSLRFPGRQVGHVAGPLDSLGLLANSAAALVFAGGTCVAADITDARKVQPLAGHRWASASRRRGCASLGAAALRLIRLHGVSPLGWLAPGSCRSLAPLLQRRAGCSRSS